MVEFLNRRKALQVRLCGLMLIYSGPLDALESSWKGWSMAESTITPAVLRVVEAASYLACSERKVWTLIKDGELPAIRFGRITRVERADLDAFIQQAKGASLAQ